MLRAIGRYLRQVGVDLQPDLHRPGADRERRPRPAAGRPVPRPSSTPSCALDKPTAADQAEELAGTRSRPGWTTWPALTTTGSSGSYLAVLDGRRSGPTSTSPAARPSRSSCCPARSPTCPSRGRSSRSSSTRPRVEGVHLRFGPVARGGLRWSDRAEDFRTEILGLVKAQMVKNTVIVPVGAKGGFYGKRLPDPSVDREAWLAEGVACYQLFITSLLDVTDNIVDGDVVPPTDVIRYDGDDPYLVVAADKGTATFSDIANEISIDAGFWLGDAFASGGSAGYDHKAMGITARGAWESVQRHFREMGIDSPDHGLHLRRHRRHERRRVRQRHAAQQAHQAGGRLRPPARVHRPRSRPGRAAGPSGSGCSRCPGRAGPTTTRSLISAGGGVFPRTLKSITDHASQMRAALGIAKSVEALSPARADQRLPEGAGRPAVERRHRHLRQGDRRDQRRRWGTRPTTGSGSTAARCGPAASARAATSA